MREKLMKSSIVSLLIASTIFTYNMDSVIKADETDTVSSTEAIEEAPALERPEEGAETETPEEATEETPEEAPAKTTEETTEETPGAAQDLLVGSSPEKATEEEIRQQAITAHDTKREADKTPPVHESQDNRSVEGDGTREPVESPIRESEQQIDEEVPEPSPEEVTAESSIEEVPKEAFAPAEATSEEPPRQPEVDAADKVEPSTETLTPEPEGALSEPDAEQSEEAVLEEPTAQSTVETPAGAEKSESTVEVPVDEPVEEATGEPSAEPSIEGPTVEHEEMADDEETGGYMREEIEAEIHPDAQPASLKSDQSNSGDRNVNRQNYYRYDQGNILEGISLNPGTSEEQLNLLDKRVNRLMTSKIMPEDAVDGADILEIEEEIKNEEGVMASTDREALPNTGKADYTFLYGTTLLIAGAILLFITRRPNNHKCK